LARINVKKTYIFTKMSDVWIVRVATS
jgi:hypothetical protein